MKFPKFVSKGAAAITAATLSFASLALGAVTSSSAAEEAYSFTRCVEDKRAANVLIMMDETGSVFKADAENLRVAGAEVLLNRLQRVADVYATNINIMLAGFGDNFVPRPEGTSTQWIPLTPNKPESGLDGLVTTAREWSKPTKNQIETDTLSGIDGATKALAAQPSDSCKLFVFFKDGVDFQYFNRNTKNPSDIPDYPAIHDLLVQGKHDQAEKDAIDEICRPGGLADGLRIDDNIYTLGVALNTTKGPAEGVEDFVSMIEGKSSSRTCGEKPAKGKVLRVDNVADLPSLFGKALDPDFVPSTKTGSFTVNMKRALTSVNILSSGISSTFNDFTIKLAPTCADATPIKLTRGTDIKDQVIGGSVTLNAKWAGSDPATSKTLNITLQHTNQVDDSCWVGLWTIDPGTDTLSTLYFDADLKAVAKFEGAEAVMVRGEDGKASQNYSIEIQHPSDATNAKVAVGSLDPDLDFTISGFLRDANSKTRVASSWDGYTVTKSNIDQPQTLSVDGLELGDYELVLTMQVSVKDFNYNLSPISTQRIIKLGNPYAAPTTKGVVDFKNIEGTSRAKGVVTFVGSKDADFEISVADIATTVDASQFPKGLSYQILLPDGVADGIKIPKGQTVTQEFELAVKLPDGTDSVNAQGPVRGNLVFAAKAVDYPSQGVSKVKTEFVATQLASANPISQLFWVAVFTLLGLILPILALIFITLKISRFPGREISENVTAAAFTVRYSGGEVTNADELIREAGNLANFPRIEVAADRKSASVGFDTFRVKVNPFGLKAISHAELENSSALGSSASDPSKPHLSLNLGSEWVFHTDVSNIDPFADSTSGTGTLVLVVNFASLTAPELVTEFLRKSPEILASLPGKSSAGIFGNDSNGFGSSKPQNNDDDLNLFGN